MNVNRNKIVKYCEEYLKVKDFKDFCHNGLQVEGSEKVNKILTGVSLSQKLIEVAVGEKAEMIIVHHGIFSNQLPELPVFRGYFKKRLKLLLENNINLCGFHLPLDAHSVIGNNASLAKIYKLKKIKPIDVGFVGEYEKARDFKEIVAITKDKVHTKPDVISAGPKMVKRVGIISGAASSEFEEVKNMGVDTYITGDIRENVVRSIEELGMNFINAGHYNTEIFGVKNLGELLEKKFGVSVRFVDIPCDI